MKVVSLSILSIVFMALAARFTPYEVLLVKADGA